MAKTWGVPGKRQTYLSPGEQIAKLPKVPLNANPLQSWDYKKSRYRRVDLFPKAVSENTQQGGVIPIVSDVTPSVTPTNTPTPSVTPTNTPTPSGIIESCSLIYFGFVGPEPALFEFTDCSANTIQFNGVDGWNATYCGNYASATILSGDGVINYVGTCSDPSEYNPITVALGYSSTDPYESCTNPTTNYYQSIGQSLVIGDSIYTDYSLDPSFYAPDGYYSDGADVYVVTGNTGSIDSIIPCAVTPTPTPTNTNTPTPSITPTNTPTPSSTPIPIFPNWETNNLSSNDFMTSFDYYKNSYSLVSSASTTFGSYTAPLWYGGVAAPNGRVIGIPYRTTTVLAIETSADTATTFGNFTGDFKWAGGVLAPNGFVYGVPFNSTSIIKIDPVNLSASTFGNLTGNTKWFGGCLGSNGKIYCAPYDSNQILEIDPTNDSTRLFGSISATTGGVARYSGGVLAPNNKIYFIPRRNSSVLELDTSNDGTVFFGSLSGDFRYSSAALAYDGKIYCAPNDSSNVMIIDPDTQGLSFIGSFSGSNLYTEAVNGPDGNIYAVPLKSTSMLKINVSSQTTSNVGSYSSSIFNFGGGALGVNGCIYFIPLENTAIHRIGNTGQTLDENFVLSRYINKL